MKSAPDAAFGLWQYLSDPTVQSVLGILILLAVCSVAFHLLSRLRDSTKQDVPMDELLRKNFEEMRSGGDINEAEFRNIASLLAEQPRRSTTRSPETDRPPAAETEEK
jgi:hypothetical protein